MNIRTLGWDLARRRAACRLTQGALAERMGTTQSAISKVESGRTLPTLPFLERFARATGQPLELVLGTDEPMPSRDERRRRVHRVLGDSGFDPWQRDPTDAEARTLIADGLTRERLQSSTPPSAGQR
jgi:transcriptional regulator with XRE-family HTH domain